MEHGSEQPFFRVPAQEAESGEDLRPPVYDLPERLHHVETDDLRALREEAVAALRAGAEDASDVANAYFEQSMARADALPDRAARPEAQVGVNLAMALMQRDVGHGEQYDPARIRNYVDALEEVMDQLDGLIADGAEHLVPTYQSLIKAHDDELDDYDARMAS